MFNELHCYLKKQQADVELEGKPSFELSFSRMSFGDNSQNACVYVICMCVREIDGENASW